MWKKCFILIFSVLVFSEFADMAFATDTCCVAHGGDYYCDYATSKLYCADGTISTQCACHPAASVSPTPSPTSPPTPSPTPLDCPSFSYFDAPFGECKCNSGYLVYQNMCVSFTDYCWTNYGGNSIYDTSRGGCTCSQGYTWNNSGTSCISLNEFCQNTLGNQSFYNTNNNTCNCLPGYSIQNGECQITPTLTPSVSPSTSEAVATNTPAPNPSVSSLTIPNPTPTKSQVQKITPHKIPISKTNSKNFVAIEKPNQNIVIKIIASIWNFMLHAF